MMPRTTPLLLAGLLLGLLAALPPVAAAPETAGKDQPLELRIGRHPDFLRLVFEAPGLAARARGESGKGATLLRLPAPLGAGPVARLRRLSLVAEVEARADGVLRLVHPRAEGRLFALPPDRLVVDLRERAAAQPASVPPAPTASRAEPASGHAAPRKPAAEAANSGAPPPTEEPLAEAAASGSGRLRVWAEMREDAVRLVFAWDRPVPAALYRRGQRLVLVFAASSPDLVIDRGSLRDQARAAVRRLRGGRQREATVLEFELAEGLAAAVRRRGNLWYVQFGDPPGGQATPLDLRIRDGALVLAPIDALVRITDRASGERLWVGATLEAGRGRPSGLTTVDVAVPPSLQGAVVRPRSDLVRVRRAGRELVVERTGGLRLSQALRRSLLTEAPGGAPAQPEPAVAQAASDPLPEPSERADAVPVPPAEQAEQPDRVEVPGETVVPPPSEERAEGGPSPSQERAAARDPERDEEGGDAEPAATVAAPIADMPPWTSRLGLQELADLTPEDRLRLAQRLRRLLAEAERPERRGALRLELARLLLAEALGREVRIQLDALGPEERAALGGEMGERLRDLALAGAALGGGEEIDLERLSGEEWALWRLIVAAERRQWDRAAADLDPAHRQLGSYPLPLQVRLAPKLILAALQAGQIDRAYVWLDRAGRWPLARFQRDRLRFLEALAVARDGGGEEAAGILADLVQNADWFTAVRAAYARIQLARDAGALDPEAVRARLEEQRPLWRGHPWEPSMLAALGEAEAQTGRVAEALARWSDVLARFPDDPIRTRLSARMRETLERALAGRRELGLTPVEAFALYRRYPEFAPSLQGREEAYLRLAEDLIAAGLAPAARSLLLEVGTLGQDPMLEARRLMLLARAEVEEDPKRALATLARARALVRDPPWPRALEAELYLAAGRPREALAGLASEDGPELLPLLLEAAWMSGEPELLRDAALRLARELEASDQPLGGGRLRAFLAALAGLLRAGDAAAFEALVQAGRPRISDPDLIALIELARPRPSFAGPPEAVIRQIEAYVPPLRAALGSAPGENATAPPGS